MKTHDFITNKKDYVELSKYPDFLFRDKKTGEEIYVEAKYRENLYQEKLQWCSMYQLNRYKEIGKSKKVIIAIGLGGRPKYPQRLFIIPLSEAIYPALFPSIFEKHEHNIPNRTFINKIKDSIYGFQKI